MTPDEIPDSVADESFSAEEQAYLDSKGTSDVPAEPKAEAKAQPEKAEAKAEEPKAEPEKEPEVEKLVKHGAFEEERQRRKKAEAATRELELRLARLEGQRDGLKPVEQPKAPSLDEIDEQKNPLEAIAALKQEIRARKEAEQQSQQINSIITTGQQYCRKFAEAEPQFFGKDGQEGAYAFLRRSTAERMAERGLPAHEIEQAVNLAEIRLINDSLAQGLDPARAMWHWAHVAGFKPAAAAPSPAPAAEQNRAPNGQFKAEKSEAERVVDIEKAQKASKSLGSVPAGSGDGVLTLEALADMDEDEFAAATSGNKWGKLHRNGVV
jgi:hypothetical protein